MSLSLNSESRMCFAPFDEVLRDASLGFGAGPHAGSRFLSISVIDELGFGLAHTSFSHPSFRIVVCLVISYDISADCNFLKLQASVRFTIVRFFLPEFYDLIDEHFERLNVCLWRDMRNRLLVSIVNPDLCIDLSI
jgi:hypothetical protein